MARYAKRGRAATCRVRSNEVKSVLPAIKYENNLQSESRLSRAFYFKSVEQWLVYRGSVANYDNTC